MLEVIISIRSPLTGAIKGLDRNMWLRFLDPFWGRRSTFIFEVDANIGLLTSR